MTLYEETLILHTSIEVVAFALTCTGTLKHSLYSFLSSLAPLLVILNVCRNTLIQNGIIKVALTICTQVCWGQNPTFLHPWYLRRPFCFHPCTLCPPAVSCALAPSCPAATLVFPYILLHLLPYPLLQPCVLFPCHTLSHFYAQVEHE